MLLYNLEQAPSEKNVIRQCQINNLPIPEKFLNAPVLTEGLGLYLSAFYELTAYRATGFSESPISWETVNAYCHEYDITGEQKFYMFKFITALDRVYLTHRAEKTKTPKADNG